MKCFASSCSCYTFLILWLLPGLHLWAHRAFSICHCSCSRASCRSLPNQSSGSGWFSAWFLATRLGTQLHPAASYPLPGSLPGLSAPHIGHELQPEGVHHLAVLTNAKSAGLHEELYRTHLAQGHHAPDCGLGRDWAVSWQVLQPRMGSSSRAHKFFL